MTFSAFSGLRMGDTGFVLIYTSWWAGTVCILCSFYEIIDEYFKIVVLCMEVVLHRGNDCHHCVERDLSKALYFDCKTLKCSLEDIQTNSKNGNFWSDSHPIPVFQIWKLSTFLCVEAINTPSSALQNDICNVISIRHPPPLSCCFSL